jgi:hypothetical protein
MLRVFDFAPSYSLRWIQFVPPGRSAFAHFEMDAYGHAIELRLKRSTKEKGNCSTLYGSL